MSEATSAEAQIRGIIEAWAQAVRAQDLDGVLKRHSNDMLLFDVPLPVQLRGIAAYRDSWAQFFENTPKPIMFGISELSITAGNDVAFAHGLISCQMEGDDQPVGLAIRLTTCLRKSGGEWTITHEHHSEAAA